MRFCGLAAVAVTLFAAVSAPAQEAGEAPLSLRIGLILPPPAVSAGDLGAPVAKAARQGATLAAEEFALNAEMFDAEFALLTEEASGPDVVAAAERLVNEGRVYALGGGFSDGEGLALSRWATEHGVPFINIGATGDALRNEDCGPTTFHLAPSAAMYLDALAGWYIRANFRRWFILQADDAAGARQHERILRTLSDRHFGGREVGSAVLAPGSLLDDATLAAIGKSGADFVLMLVDPEDQLRLLAQMEAAGLEVMVTGFPWDETQTRAFFARSREVAPRLGAAMRATEWEPTLDAYGARELNARYLDRWGEPAEGSAWATYQAVKILVEAAIFSQSTEAGDVLGYLESPDSVFDVWKGIGTSFRPWDRQLRQSLYLVKIDATETGPVQMGKLVGELPAIYMPGTDPVERLDQLGDLAGDSTCRR